MNKIHYIILSFFCILVLSCSEEVTFSSSPSSSVSFSKDTISFDTVFTTIGSSTERFQVYNDSKENLRLRNVRLASGGASGFRMNVDGRFGYSFSDVEIMHDDSIFVFVEVTVNPQNSDSPELVKDSILFTLENGRQQQVILQVYGQDVIILKGNTIAADSVFSASRPYLIYDSLVVAKDASLTLAEGTTLCFQQGASLKVHGTLLAQGTTDRPVTLRGARTDRLFSYLPYDRLDSQWGGVELCGDSYDNVIDNTDIHGGTFGVYCDSSYVSGRHTLTLTNSVVHNVAGPGLTVLNSDVLVANTQMSNSLYNCVELYGGHTDFYHCTLVQFYPWNADRGNALFMSNLVEPIRQAYFYNCFITGAADDEVYGQPIENAGDFNVSFFSCVLNTKVNGESDAQYFTDCIFESPDSATYRATNFRTIDTDNYIYDFTLDSLSIAHGKGNPKYSVDYPYTRLGKKRDMNSPDAGCY